MGNDGNHRVAGSQVIHDHLLDVVLAVEVLDPAGMLPWRSCLPGNDDEVEIVLQALAGRIAPDQRYLQSGLPGGDRDGAVLRAGLCRASSLSSKN